MPVVEDADPPLSTACVVELEDAVLTACVVELADAESPLPDVTAQVLEVESPAGAPPPPPPLLPVVSDAGVDEVGQGEEVGQSGPVSARPVAFVQLAGSFSPPKHRTVVLVVFVVYVVFVVFELVDVFDEVDVLLDVVVKLLVDVLLVVVVVVSLVPSEPPPKQRVVMHCA